MNECQRCGLSPRVKGERYCKECRKAILDEMWEKGYLTCVPWSRSRSTEQREDVRETKYGKDR